MHSLIYRMKAFNESSAYFNAPSNSVHRSRANMPSGSFFSQYPTFDHDATAPLIAEFQRLSLQRGWKADGKKYRQSRRRCFAQEFEYHYGNASDRLAGWQALCADVYITPIPPSINQCKKAGRSSHHLGVRSLTASRKCLGTLARCCQPSRPGRFTADRGDREAFPVQECASEIF